MRLTLPIPLFLSMALATCGALAQEQHAHDQPSGPGIFSLLPKTATTSHSITIGGHRLSYQAKAGTVSLLGADADVMARMFYVAYDLKPDGTKSKDEDAADRPITFVFNGGPGAASAYLQIGALGPRILETGPNGAFLPPPQKLRDNPDTWLPMTDLVFVDPVGTGYSRAAPGHKESDFWSVDSDASAMTAFIRLYLEEAGRTGSPVYMVGESYGGFRAALLAKTLQQDAGIEPAGIVLISPALEFSFVYGDEFRPLTYALSLPSIAAVALEKQGVRGAELTKRLAGIERYALSDYLVAVTGGLQSGGTTQSARVAQLTGLPLTVVRQHHARISAGFFARTADRAASKVLSMYDGTVATGDISAGSPFGHTPDPILDRSVPVVTSAFVHYLRTDLDYRSKITYRLLDGRIAGKWDYGNDHSQGYAGVLDDLQKARSLDPSLKVMIAQGYTDLVIPYMTSRYLVGQLPPLPDARPIEIRDYAGGHMMYLRPDSRHALERDAASLYAAPPAGPTK